MLKAFFLQCFAIKTIHFRDITLLNAKEGFLR